MPKVCSETGHDIELHLNNLLETICPFLKIFLQSLELANFIWRQVLITQTSLLRSHYLLSLSHTGLPAAPLLQIGQAGSHPRTLALAVLST